jgi:4-amino-4-deoxy-L-arabinose transferase-like glycosyltransferase
MDATTDQQIYDVLAGFATALLVAYALYLLVRFLARSRPGLAIGVPIAAAAVIRGFAAAGVSLTSIGAELRGGDEVLFQQHAHAIADSGFGSTEWLDALTGTVHEFVLAVQVWAFDSPEFVLRLGEITLAVAGIVLLATAVYELAGARAAVLAAWILALEPSGIFFSSLLHKESPMFLAEGLVAFGGARMWKRGDLVSLAIVACGCLVGVATRPYAGWFLIAAGAAITLHAGLRTTRKNEVSAVGLIAIVVLVGAIFAPTVWEASSDESLEQNVQASQDANAADDEANLSLEQVDFSTREAVIINLPVRMWDVTFRPYIWEVESASQRIGAIGGLFTLALLAVLGFAIARRRGQIMDRAGPLIYLGFFLLAAYSLSTGNAGTGFRYRTHLLAIAVCVIASLWVWRTERAMERVRGPLPDRVDLSGQLLDVGK